MASAAGQRTAGGEVAGTVILAAAAGGAMPCGVEAVASAAAEKYLGRSEVKRRLAAADGIAGCGGMSWRSPRAMPSQSCAPAAPRPPLDARDAGS